MIDLLITSDTSKITASGVYLLQVAYLITALFIAHSTFIKTRLLQSMLLSKITSISISRT